MYKYLLNKESGELNLYTGYIIARNLKTFGPMVWIGEENVPGDLLVDNMEEIYIYKKHPKDSHFEGKISADTFTSYIKRLGVPDDRIFMDYYSAVEKCKYDANDDSKKLTLETAMFNDPEFVEGFLSGLPALDEVYIEEANNTEAEDLPF